jgi:hypothetical protein
VIGRARAVEPATPVRRHPDRRHRRRRRSNVIRRRPTALARRRPRAMAPTRPSRHLPGDEHTDPPTALPDLDRAPSTFALTDGTNGPSAPVRLRSRARRGQWRDLRLRLTRHADRDVRRRPR